MYERCKKMGAVKILDCTLRDGGYVNSWKFGRGVIKDMIHNLVEAGIDIVECGFIRNVEDDADSSVFSSMDKVVDVIEPKAPNVLYAIMIEQRNYNPERICQCSDKTADLIRVTFRRREWDSAKVVVQDLMNKGYRVCIQPVGTDTYDTPSLIKLIQEVNELNPYAFYLVDTLGMMYRDEMRKFFYLIDDNLSKNIFLGFHSHNNLQMSFANAQEMIRLNRGRTIIIDASCYGMGRGVGNLPTELITDHVNNDIGQKYSLIPILNIVDKYLMPIYSQQRWGYALPFFLSATFKCHPNYAAHLIRKETLSIEKIEKLLSLIPNNKKYEYNADLIEKLYLGMQSFEIDDKDSYLKLNAMVENREVLLLGPGSSINKFKTQINKKAKGSIVISANFIPEDYQIDALFISNVKRLGTISIDLPQMIFATSNLKNELSNAVFLNYSTLLGEGDALDNAGAMLIRALKKCAVNKIYIAGFDGFEVNATANYAVAKFKTVLDYDMVLKKNVNIARQLKLALSGVEYEIITPTKYKI